MVDTPFSIMTSERLEQPLKQFLPIVIILPGIAIEDSPVQLANAPSAMFSTPYGIIVFLHPTTSALVAVTMIALHSARESYLEFEESTVMLDRFLQFPKIWTPMLVKPLPMVTDVKLEQPVKAKLPMLVTLLGITMLVRAVQYPKAPPFMFFTVSGIMIVPLQAWTKVLDAVSMMALQLFLESNIGLLVSTVMVVKLAHSLKIPLSMIVTLAGMLTVVSSGHPEKA